MTPPLSQNSSSNPTQEEIWKALALEAQAGDKRAYNQLLRELVPFIHSVVVPRIANPDWAGDITQEVLLSIHKSLHTFAPDRPFKPWLISIINFRKTDFLRQYYNRHGNKKVSVDEHIFQAQHVTEPNMIGEYKDVEAAMADLPEKQREIFRLLKIEGYTAKEVALKMDMSESAVKVSAHRTLNKLKELRD